MLEESLIVLEPTSAYPLSITAEQYCYHIPNKVDSHTQDPDTITLILLHGTSFHKETWEPTLMHIFDLAAKRNPNAGGVDIREAWAIECPNHVALPFSTKWRCGRGRITIVVVRIPVVLKYARNEARMAFHSLLRELCVRSAPLSV